MDSEGAGEYKNVFSLQDIEEIGVRAREEVDSVYDECRAIASYVVSFLVQGGLPSEQGVRELFGAERVYVKPEEFDGVGAQHFVVVIDGIFIEGCEQGERVIVDASFDQFNAENEAGGRYRFSFGKRSELEDVRILLPNDRRLEQYEFVDV